MKLLKEIFIAILYIIGIGYFGIIKGNVNVVVYTMCFILSLKIDTIKDLIKNQNKNH